MRCVTGIMRIKTDIDKEIRCPNCWEKGYADKIKVQMMNKDYRWERHPDFLVIHNHNFVMNLNHFFAEHPKAKLSRKDFLVIQLMQWKATKKALGIKI